MSELDPCKFCGSGDVHTMEYIPASPHYDRLYCVGCDNCGTNLSNFVTKEQAIAAWNRKPEPEPITAEALQALGFVEDTPAFGNWQWFELEKNGKLIQLEFRNNGLRLIEFSGISWSVLIKKEKCQSLTMSDLLVLIKAFC